MKFNKWTLGLAALGVVSLPAATQAVEKNASYLETTLNNVGVSGYVDTSVEWSLKPSHSQMRYPGAGGPSYGNYESFPPAIPFRGYYDMNKQDGFNLNVVQVNFEKPLDESEWASGFKASFLFGPDAVGYNPSANADSDSDFAIKQAYVNLRTPGGNGIEWKIGVFDTIVGYEVFEAGNNPNFTRSLGYAIEPTEHTGILGSYSVNDNLSFNFGVANTHWAGINERTWGPNNSFWYKTVMGSVSYTAPDSWGFLSGATLYGGVVFSPQNDSMLNGYFGAVAHPSDNLSVGFAYDLYWQGYSDVGSDYSDDLYENVFGLYASYRVSEKFSLHGRAEYWNYVYKENYPGYYDYKDCENGYELTLTAQYDLWANVISRLELRWDHYCGDYYYDEYGQSESESIGLYANFIFTF